MKLLSKFSFIIKKYLFFKASSEVQNGSGLKYVGEWLKKFCNNVQWKISIGSEYKLDLTYKPYKIYLSAL